MRLWDVTTMTDQVFKIAAFTSTEALEVYFVAFPNEKEIKALNDVGLYTVRPQTMLGNRS